MKPDFKITTAQLEIVGQWLGEIPSKYVINSGILELLRNLPKLEEEAAAEQVPA